MSTNYPQMQTPATAPSFGGNKTLNPNKILLAPGMQPAVLFAVVDLGTHMESYQNGPLEPKRKIMVGFEFPQLKQMYYLEDEKPRSCMITKESTFVISEKSFLKALISGIYGRVFTDQECRDFDVMKLVGMKVLANIVHTPIKSGKNMGQIKETIHSISSLGNFPLPVGFEPELPYQSFYIDPQGNNFMTSNFANLMPWIKKKVYASLEAETRKSQGLPFAKSQEELDRESGTTQQNQNYQSQANYQQQPQHQTFSAGTGTGLPSNPSTPTPPLPIQQQAPQPKVLMLNNQNYEAFIAQGWTDELLVQNGYAVWNQQSVQTPPAAPVTPPVPPVTPPVASPQNNVPGANMAAPVGNPFMDEDDDLPF